MVLGPTQDVDSFAYGYRMNFATLSLLRGGSVAVVKQDSDGEAYGCILCRCMRVVPLRNEAVPTPGVIVFVNILTLTRRWGQVECLCITYGCCRLR